MDISRGHFIRIVDALDSLVTIHDGIGTVESCSPEDRKMLVSLIEDQVYELQTTLEDPNWQADI